MYKGLTNENPPGITILNPPPPCFTRTPTDYQAQFGPLRLYHGQFFVTWDVSRLWVLDTSPCALVGYHDNLGDIVDVRTAGHEIYVLQRGGERPLIKLTLIPKLTNPLLDVVELLERSYKSDEQDNEKQQEPTGEDRVIKIEVQASNKVGSYSSLKIPCKSCILITISLRPGLDAVHVLHMSHIEFEFRPSQL